MSYIGSENTRLYYEVWGEGKQTILAFHGFGLDHEIFRDLVNFKVYSFDIPYHGKSHWADEEEALSIDWLKENLSSLLEKENIDDFSVLGFSIGSRMTQGLLKAFPEKISSVYWIAPDGVYQNFWFMLGTRFPGKQLYALGMFKMPGLLKLMARAGRSLRLIPESAYRIAIPQLEEPHRRERAYRTWVVFRKMVFSAHSIQLIQEEHQIPMQLFLGSRDRIIEPHKVRAKLKDIPLLNIHELNANHFDLLDKSLKIINQE